MKKTYFLRRLLTGLALTLTFQIAQAAIVAGTDYVVINQPQPVETGNKIEVVEAFSYMCPHCYQFEPRLVAWIKTLPADVTVRKLPIGFNRDEWNNLAKTFYALDAMGLTSKMNSKVFDAIHTQKIDLSNSKVLFDWVGKQGVDSKKFSDTYDSFGIQAKMTRGTQLARAYGILSVPSFVVDGKYRVTASGSFEDLFRVTEEVIALARSQRPAKTTMSSAATPASPEKKVLKK